MVKKIIKWCNSLRYYVIADPNDNSITLSKALFNHIKSNAKGSDAARVFVFRINTTQLYGFMANPSIKQSTYMCDIQYNDKYRCIGFETLCPSVGQILYDYGLPATQCIKLSVTPQHTQDNKRQIYYQLDKPDEKHIRQYQKGGHHL
ncbi:MAG: hypothetical protein ACI358_01520 [Candidatus Limimorpha sp.]